MSIAAIFRGVVFTVSGLSGTAETAQSQVSVGMGLLAGSTIMLLTLIWGSCVLVGKCDISETDSLAIDGKDTKGFNLFGSGVSTDIWTCYAARIMAISGIPFLVVQLPQLLDSTSGRQLAVLIALIISVSMLISYCLYQIFQPWIQRRRLAFAKHKHLISGILRHLRQCALGRLINENGDFDRDVIHKLFTTIDENKDGYLSPSEIKALIVGIQFEEIDFDHDEAVKKIMRDFDLSGDNRIQAEEFLEGIKKWLEEAMCTRKITPDTAPRTMKILNDFYLQTKRSHALLGPEERREQSDEVVEGVKNARWVSIKAVIMLLLGTAITAAFADPLVDAVDNFSDATSIPSFFISFIALPLATSSREAVSAIICVRRKKFRTSSLTFSELYGAVTMKNILSLSVFLAVVYIRGLSWDFSSKVLVIFIVCFVMGIFGSLRTTFPLWTSFLAFLLYPFSLALVFVLDYILGWS